MLAFVGRNATRFMAGGVLLGLVAPPLAALARPLLVPALLIPLSLALLRLDWRAVVAFRHRVPLVAALLVWILGVSPVLVWVIVTPLAAIGFPPTLALALILMAASSPIVSCVAIALFVGLDAALAVVAVLLATALVPFTLPPLAHVLAGVALEIPIAAFSLRLALLVGSAFAGAWLIRRVVGAQALARHSDLIDGIAVVNLVVFALAIMDGVTAFALARPGYAFAALVAAFAFNLLLQALAWLAFRALGPRGALTAALLAGNCNMGLVLVALAGTGSFEVTVFFALAQIPMYMLPAMLTPLYRRALAASGGEEIESR